MAPVAMTLDTSVHALFGTLRQSLEAATDALPQADALDPSADGISLLDVKNELLLSYLHNLVFLILLKLRGASSSGSQSAETNGDAAALSDDVVKQLVELRVYLEKGVRPLEGRLKYQIEKVIRAADDAERNDAATSTKPASKHHKQHISDEEDDDDSAASEIDELSYRPNPAAFIRPTIASAQKAEATDKNGIYRPPRIAATAMPTGREREQREARRPHKSAVLDEYVASELSTAPAAEPSIGSTIVSGGRRTKSQRERADEAERREYEETNFVRLPKDAKKERAKTRAGDRGRAFGGEEWTNIDAGLDRIDRLTQRKRGGSKLASSRKRAIDDGPRDSGVTAGERFDKRRRLDQKKRNR